MVTLSAMVSDDYGRLMMTTTDKMAVSRLMAAVVESVMEGDSHGETGSNYGTPGGTLYAALMTTGMSYDSFNQLMDGLVHSGALVKNGQCYKATRLGREFVAAVNRHHLVA